MALARVVEIVDAGAGLIQLFLALARCGIYPRQKAATDNADLFTGLLKGMPASANFRAIEHGLLRDLFQRAVRQLLLGQRRTRAQQTECRGQ